MLRVFAERAGISYPLLSDPDSEVIRAFALLNETVERGSPYFGVPWPGTFVIDAQGVVQAKFFEKSYRERYTAGNILLRVSPADATGWIRTTTKHLTLRHGASDVTVHGGSRITLGVEVDLPAKMHVYAPGVEGGYIPIALCVEAPTDAVSHPPTYPGPKLLHLPAIGETVPTYEGSFRIAQDLTFPQQDPLLSLAGAAATVTVKGAFRYQACDDEVCYAPTSVPLEWTFSVATHDRQRAPEPLRRK